MLAVSVLVSIILPWVSAAGLRRSPPHQAPLQAADEDSHRSPALSEADEGKQNRMQALLDRYAPVFKLSYVLLTYYRWGSRLTAVFSETEAYFPSSIDYMLSHFDHVRLPGGQTQPANSPGRRRRRQLDTARSSSLPSIGFYTGHPDTGRIAPT
jgi:hypothetical protein